MRRRFHVPASLATRFAWCDLPQQQDTKTVPAGLASRLGTCDLPEQPLFTMGLRLPNQDSANCFFVTTSFDRHQRLGDVPGFYETLAESVAFCLDKYHAILTGYVFMPTHIHLLLVIDARHLGGFMRDLKKYIAQKAAPDMGIHDVPLWQSRYDRVSIFSDDIYRTKLEYIHNNPVKSGLTSKPSDWHWSSATDYLTDRAGPIPTYKEWAR